MKKEFIPYEQALALKELGFDESCFGLYDNTFPNEFFQIHSEASVESKPFIKAPLYQQAFEWLYQKMNIQNGGMPINIEARILKLKEVIELFKKW